LTPNEYVTAQLLNYRSSAEGVVLLIVYWIAGPAFGLIAMLGAGSIARASGFTLSSVTGLIVPTLLVFLPLWLHLYLRYRFRLTRISDGACYLDFDEECITTEMPGFSKGTVEWAAVKKWRANNKVLLIYVSRASFLVVPIRAFAAGEFEELVATLRRKIAPIQRSAA
jgi:hypothetical protein